MRELSLNVRAWSAWAPGIDRCASWAQWSVPLARDCRQDKPDIQFIKPMVRRRLSGVSKLALSAVHRCQQAGIAYDSGIFCSRHGETVRTLSIYHSIVESGVVSPTQFSQSVHSTSAGVLSIENQLQIPFTAIAAGLDTAEQGFIEAWAQIATGYSCVLMVMADDHLEEPFSYSVATPEYPFAVAMLLGHYPDYPLLSLRQTGTRSPVLGGTDNLLAAITGQRALGLDGDNGWEWQWNGD